MQQIQISRGDLATRILHGGDLLNGEFFFDTNAEELFVGTSDGPVKVGDNGVLSYTDSVSTLPAHPIRYGVYYITADIEAGSTSIDGIENDAVYPEFRAGDLAIAIPGSKNGSDEDSSTNTFGGCEVVEYYKWLRIKCGGGNAEDVEFDSTGTHYDNEVNTHSDNIINVQQALVDADRRKLEFAGTLNLTDIVTTDGLPETTTSSGTTYYKYASDADFLKVVALKSTYTYAGTSWDTVNKQVLRGGVAFEISGSALVIGSQKYEVGDFIYFVNTETFDHTETTTEAASTYNTYIQLGHISGGSHDPSKLYITGLSRGNENAITVYEGTSGSTFTGQADSAITNVKDAITTLFKSKADLDPSTKKILLAELPDTIVGGLDYQGTYDGWSSNEDKETVVWHLPTVNDKTSVDTDSGTTTNALTKGDYWVYSGDEYDIQDLIAAGTVSCGDKSLASGDYLIYQGNNLWGVINNVAPFIGLSANNVDLDQTLTTLDGMVDFPSTTRKTSESDTTGTAEITVTADSTKNTMTVTAPAALLAKDGSFLSTDELYKEAGNGTLVDANINAGTTLKITNSDTAIKIVSSSDTAKSVTVEMNTDQAAKTALTVQLPNEDGTLATVKQIKYSDSDGTDDVHPMYYNDGEFIRLRNSNVTSTRDSDTAKTLRGISIAHSTKSTELLASKKNDTLQRLPSFSGILLNTNSIIDCGYWSKGSEEPTYINEGTYNTDFYTNDASLESFEDDE